MDEELANLAHETDDDHAAAARWWLRLKLCGRNAAELSEFTHWLAQNADRQWAFAQVEALWMLVQRAQSAREPADADPQTALRSSVERAK